MMKASGELPGVRAQRIVADDTSRVSIYDGPDTFLGQFNSLPIQHRVLFATWWADEEICNGGFLQLFENSTGVLAPDAVSGFRVLDLGDLADVVETAIRSFPAPYPRDRAARRAILSERGATYGKTKNPFEPLDELYFSKLHAAPNRYQTAADNYAELNGL
jgi:hypothetical protein